MLFRHKLLLALADGQPHELRELYSMLGRQIRPEQAARMYQENSKYNPEERLQKGRMRILVSELASIRGNGWAEEIAGTGLYRTHIITDEGRIKANLIQQEADAAVVRPRETGAPGRRNPDALVSDAAKDVMETLKVLLNDQWTDEDTLFQISTENVPQETAERAYLFYSRSKGKKWTPDVIVHYGKKVLFTRCTGHLRNVAEFKMEKGKRWIRLRPQPEETFPKLAKIG